MKAIGMYIFGGSNSIAVMQSGYVIDRVLEISDDILEKNAYHFHKNYPDIDIVLPSEWKTSDYLESLEAYNYDLFYANNPCSGLSRINIKNAGASNETNKYFYDVFDAIFKIKPKTFLIENAPTLTTIGVSILEDLNELLGEEYYINICSDCAGNHNVAMKRARTLITGFRKDTIKGCPIHRPNKQVKTTVKDVIGDLYNVEDGDLNLNNFSVTPVRFDNLSIYYNMVPQNKSVMNAMIHSNIDYSDSTILTDYQKRFLNRGRAKVAEGKNFFDKFPYRLSENDVAPSLTSLSKFIHPIKDRGLTTREYARIMGYPDDFEFYDECKTHVIQCIAQGVPVNFIKYALSAINEAYSDSAILINANCTYQNNMQEMFTPNPNFIEPLVGEISLNNVLYKKLRRKLF